MGSGIEYSQQVVMRDRSWVGALVDWIAFPLRALFVNEESKFGLSSLRDERMRRVASFTCGKVLDVGCGRGNLFISTYHPEGVGIDVFKYSGVQVIVKDMEDLPFEDETFDCVTLIAVGGHIPKQKRKGEFKEFSRVLKPFGRLIMTEGEPITQYLSHKLRDLQSAMSGKKNMDLERGMEEGEEYCMSREEILHLLNSNHLAFEKKKSFMWGMNNIYIAIKKYDGSSQQNCPCPAGHADKSC